MIEATPKAAATAPVEEGPSLTIRVAAVTVVLALAALAYYAVFAGPTTVRVSVSQPAKSAPARTAPAGGEPGDGQESGRGG